MSIIISENSWATIAEADEYLTYKLGTQEWFTLEDEPASGGAASKETYLRMSYTMLVNKAGYCLTSSLTDDNVKYAQAELAYYFVDNYEVFVSNADIAAKGLRGFTMSKWKEDYNDGVVWLNDYALPIEVANLLNDYRCDNTTVNMSIE